MRQGTAMRLQVSRGYTAVVNGVVRIVGSDRQGYSWFEACNDGQWDYILADAPWSAIVSEWRRCEMGAIEDNDVAYLNEYARV